MASPTSAPTASSRCVVHHCPSGACPPASDLSDALDVLVLEGVFNFPHDLGLLGECSACPGVPQQAECVVEWRSRESQHRGFVYLEEVCAGCLYAAAMFEVRRGSRVAIRVPATSAVA